MSPLKFLEELVMSWLGFFCKIAAVTFPLFGALHVMFIVFNDEFLSRNIKVTLVLIALFGFTCCLVTLSKICVLRRKSHAVDKSIEQLWDTDLKWKNETEEVPYYELSCHYKDIGTTLINFFLKNPFAFCKFRPAYGMFLATGFVSLFAFVAAFKQVKERNTQDDLYCVAVELIAPMIMSISVIYFIANTGYYIARKDYDVYTPFEEFVQVPMKIIIGKTVAIFLSGGVTHWFLTFFLITMTALSIVSSNYFYHITELDDVLKCFLPPIFPDPRKVLRTVLIITSVVFVNALVGIIVSAYTEAKKSILDITEKNWQRNVRAVAFLLEDTETQTLQDLKNALDHKSTLPLTENEEKAFNYISWPLWQIKAPFMLQKFESDLPDLENLGEEQLKDNDEPESIQQPDATVKPEHKEYKDVDQPPVVHEVLQGAKTSTSPTKHEESRLDEPSTSSANS